MRTLVGLFENASEAKITMDDLKRIGARGKDISVISPEGRADIGDLHLEPVELGGLGDIAGCGPMTNYLSQSTASHAPDAIASALVSMGLPRREAERYVDGVRRGHTLEALVIADDKADEALAIMRQHALGGERDEARISGLGRSTTAGSNVEGARAGLGRGEERIIPVIVEELAVGKREVEGGSVQVATHVTERPVEERVELRQEHVDVERRPVDRTMTEEEADRAFREQSIEMIAKSEEPVVEKRAHVVEEIVLTKDVDTRTETVRDTVRRTEPEIHERDREHFEETYAGSAERIETHGPAYRFGSGMREDERFAGEDWSKIEPRARTAWEEKNPGTWERFKDSIKHAWHRAKT